MKCNYMKVSTLRVTGDTTNTINGSSYYKIHVRMQLSVRYTSKTNRPSFFPTNIFFNKVDHFPTKYHDILQCKTYGVGV